jgi:hypothetical protein
LLELVRGSRGTAVSVATATPLPSPRPAAAQERETATAATTLELVVIGAANLAIVLLAAISAALLAVGHRERMETAFFLAAVVLTPAGVNVARKQVHRVGPERSPGLALLGVAGLSLAILTAWAAATTYGTHVVPGILLAAAIILAGASVAVHRRPTSLPRRSDAKGWTVAILGTCTLLGLAVSSFLPGTLLDPARVWLGSLVVILVAAASRMHVSVSTFRGWRRGIDAVVLAAIVLVATDLNDYTRTIRYDYDFFLGPVNAMRHGHPLLVDTFSQYGVGMFYALAGVFHAVPLTYQGLQLVLCVAYVIEFVLVYAVLRLACTSQAVAVLGLGVALVATLAVPIPPFIGYPSTGPLRFGLPWIVILAGMLRARSTKHRRVLDAIMLATVAVGAVWSIETFAYCLAAYVAITATSLADREPDGTRDSFVATRIAGALVAAVLLVATTSLVVLVLAGDWPSWTGYLSLVTLYAMRGFGSLLIPAWSPGYLVGGLYLLSLAAFVAIPRAVRTRHEPTVAATAGATAFGAVAFTYFLGRSAPSNLHHVALPAVVASCGWWTICRPYLRTVGGAYRWATVIGASCVCASLLASNTQAIGGWIDRSPLAQVVRSPRAAVADAKGLLGERDADPRIAEGAALLRAHGRPGRRPVVLVSARRLTAVLLAARQGNALPIVNGNQDGLADRPALRRITAAADRLHIGTIVLTETMFMRQSPQSFAGLDPIRDGLRFGDYFVSRSYAELAERFDLRVLGRGRYGYVVLQLGMRK